MIRYYYIYLDRLTHRYEILQTSENNLIGTYGSIQTHDEFYFACFTRITDASDYVKRENERIKK